MGESSKRLTPLPPYPHTPILFSPPCHLLDEIGIFERIRMRSGVLNLSSGERDPSRIKRVCLPSSTIVCRR